jgi:uncharacterized OB-fold protein
MDVIRDEAWKKPLPGPEESEKPFYEAAARGELRYQKCPACDHRQFYPRPLCTACGADPEWAVASGRGRIHTFTIVRQNFAAGFKEELPYVVAMIDLEEGVRMMGTVTGCDVDDVAVDMPVEAYAVQVEDDLAIPFWRPVTSG